MLKTWYEIFNKNWDIDLEKSMANIQSILTKRNPKKYENFLKSLNKTKVLFWLAWLKNIKERVQLIKYVYYAMRLVDDICDWDTPKKLEPEEKLSVIEISKSSRNEKSEKLWLLEKMLSEITRLSQLLWIEEDLESAILEIVLSISFDVDRILDWWKIISQDDLDKNFHKMDIEWTIWGTAIIFWLDLEKTKALLRELWDATRIWYTLEDLKDDINAWIINIPLEDMESFWITREELDDFAKKWSISEWLKKWLKRQIEKIDELLATYERKIKEQSFEYIENVRKWFYNWLLKNKVLTKYIDETLQTRGKILALIW